MDMPLAFATAAGVAPSLAPAAGPALRGSPAGASGPQAHHGADPAQASATASLLTAALAAASVASSAAAVRRKTTRGRRAARFAAAVAAAPEVDTPPPPPPPFNPAEQLGVTQPLGFFDPLGFSKVGDEEGFHKLRCAEIKHGRVAMLAAVGTVFQHFVKLPGFDKTPAGLAALGDGAGVLGFIFLLPVVGILESIYWKDNLSKEPGNFGDPARWASTGLMGQGSYSDEMRNKELNNGRMAMFSILGIMVAELATGKDGVQQFGL